MFFELWPDMNLPCCCTRRLSFIRVQINSHIFFREARLMTWWSSQFLRRKKKMGICATCMPSTMISRWNIVCVICNVWQILCCLMAVFSSFPCRWREISSCSEVFYGVISLFDYVSSSVMSLYLFIGRDFCRLIAILPCVSMLLETVELIVGGAERIEIDLQWCQKNSI